MAMRAAAPPPIALNSDTSCGIAVIFTVRAAYRPAPPPIAKPTSDDHPGGHADAVAVELLGQDQHGRRADREGHAAGRHEVAVASRGGRVHPHEPDDERSGADQPGEPDEDFDDPEGGHCATPPTRSAAVAEGLGATGFLRNIWSIRSVTT